MTAYELGQTAWANDIEAWEVEHDGGRLDFLRRIIRIIDEDRALYGHVVPEDNWPVSEHLAEHGLAPTEENEEQWRRGYAAAADEWRESAIQELCREAECAAYEAAVLDIEHYVADAGGDEVAAARSIRNIQDLEGVADIDNPWFTGAAGQPPLPEEREAYRRAWATEIRQWADSLADANAAA